MFHTQPINGPFVAGRYFFVGGPEWLGPHNKHGALIAHALFGGAYGNFEKDLRGLPPSVVDFYPNQLAPGRRFWAATSTSIARLGGCSASHPMRC